MDSSWKVVKIPPKTKDKIALHIFTSLSDMTYLQFSKKMKLEDLQHIWHVLEDNNVLK